MRLLTQEPTTFFAAPFHSSDGTQLYQYRWAPDEPSIELLVVHGYGEHARRYEEFGVELASRGIAVTAIDLRGHGMATGQRGHVKYFEQYHADVEAGLKLIIDKDTPRFILGHSHGGLIALDMLRRNYAFKEHFVGSIITNPYLGLAIPVPDWKIKVGSWIAGVYPRFSMKTGLPPGGLSRDSAKVKEYENDTLIFDAATVGWFQEASAAQERVVQHEVPELPLLFVYSDADPIADPKVNEAYAQKVSEAGQEVLFRKDELHEVLNELDRHALYEHIAQWIKDKAES